MTDKEKTFSIALRLRRVIYEDAYVGVPVTDAFMKTSDTGEGEIDFELFFAEAVRIGSDPRVDEAAHPTERDGVECVRDVPTRRRRTERAENARVLVVAHEHERAVGPHEAGHSVAARGNDQPVGHRIPGALEHAIREALGQIQKAGGVGPHRAERTGPPRRERFARLAEQRGQRRPDRRTHRRYATPDEKPTTRP